MHISFALPPSFPPHFLPEEIVSFLENDVAGKTPAQFVTLAGDKGYMPTWQPLPNYGEGYFGFGLCVDGLVIPLIVKITFGQVH